MGFETYCVFSFFFLQNKNIYIFLGTNELLRECYPPRSGFVSTIGTVASFGILARGMFGKSTRHRLFFARAPPGADIRWVTFKMAGELLLRCGAIVYGAAAGKKRNKGYWAFKLQL